MTACKCHDTYRMTCVTARGMGIIVIAPFICRSERSMPFCNEWETSFYFGSVSLQLVTRVCLTVLIARVKMFVLPLRRAKQSLPVKMFIHCNCSYAHFEGKYLGSDLFPRGLGNFIKAPALLPFIYENPPSNAGIWNFAGISRSVPVAYGVIKAFASWRARFRAANLTNVS